MPCTPAQLLGHATCMLYMSQQLRRATTDVRDVPYRDTNTGTQGSRCTSVQCQCARVRVRVTLEPRLRYLASWDWGAGLSGALVAAASNQTSGVTDSPFRLLQLCSARPSLRGQASASCPSWRARTAQAAQHAGRAARRPQAARLFLVCLLDQKAAARAPLASAPGGGHEARRSSELCWLRRRRSSESSDSMVYVSRWSSAVCSCVRPSTRSASSSASSATPRART